MSCCIPLTSYMPALVSCFHFAYTCFLLPYTFLIWMSPKVQSTSVPRKVSSIFKLPGFITLPPPSSTSMEKPGQKLNDEVVNLCLAVLAETSWARDVPNVYCFSTFLLSELMGENRPDSMNNCLVRAGEGKNPPRWPEGTVTSKYAASPGTKYTRHTSGNGWRGGSLGQVTDCTPH